MSSPKRYAIIGTGSRANMFYNALTKNEDVKKAGTLVALCDPNRTRMEYVNEKLGLSLPMYKPHEFTKMVDKENIEAIIVTTKDSLHHEYIIKGLQMGLRVISEKPMTTDEHNCQAIIDAMNETGSNLTVTFNYRYSPHRAKVKELIKDGVIGDVTLVEFHWFLDITHGADYYRRWHRNKVNSGSLLVHKATHHFDLVNWWIDSEPEIVFALGTKRFYRPETFPYHERCLTCDIKNECNFYLDMKGSEGLTKTYLEAEKEDGYFRDRCVFSPEIDIWDTRAVTVGYASGALMSYSLNNYAPYEGYKVAFVGTKGRIELDDVEKSYVSGHDGKMVPATEKSGTRLWVHPLFKDSYEVEVEVQEGGHGGGDVRLLNDVFFHDGKNPDDPLERSADGIDGAMSILTGIAARRSIEWGRSVMVDELVQF
jgi:predicted dehydrogenase